VINPSSTSLTVSAANPSDPPSMIAEAFPQAASFADAAVRGAVPGQCGVSSSGPCNLPPSSRLYAEGTPPVSIDVKIDPETTAVATAAAKGAAYVQSRLQTRAQSLQASVVACAESVKQFMSPDVYIEDAIRDAFGFGVCASLVREVDEALRAPPTPPADETPDVLRAAGRYTKNLRQDFYVFGIARIASRLR
jgi:hypothetical protein